MHWEGTLAAAAAAAAVPLLVRLTASKHLNWLGDPRALNTTIEGIECSEPTGCNYVCYFRSRFYVGPRKFHIVWASYGQFSVAKYLIIIPGFLLRTVDECQLLNAQCCWPHTIC